MELFDCLRQITSATFEHHLSAFAFAMEDWQFGEVHIIGFQGLRGWKKSVQGMSVRQQPASASKCGTLERSPWTSQTENRIPSPLAWVQKVFGEPGVGAFNQISSLV